jgi:hypothetical protein
MGFNANTQVTFIANTLTSINVIDFIPESTLYLYSDIIQTKDNNGENILQEFFASNSAPYSNLVYQCTAFEAYSKKLNRSKTNYFHFTLLNEFYGPINLNGQPFFFTIILYKRDNIFEFIKKYIKLKLKMT